MLCIGKQSASYLDAVVANSGTVFGLSLLDRTNISAAYIAGLAQDLQLAVGSRYSVALLVFFIGYCLFELPSNYVIRRVGARWWLSFLIVAWGFMVLAMGFIHDWKVLTVLRAMLGIFEAGLFPGSIYIVRITPPQSRQTY